MYIYEESSINDHFGKEKDFGASEVHLGPGGFGCSPFWSGGSVVVVDSLLIVAPIVGLCGCSMFCCALLCVRSGFAVVSVGEGGGLVALLCMSSWFLVVAVWLFFTMPWACLQFVIAVFFDHTRLLFLAIF